MAKKLTEHHPFMKKVNELCIEMQKLGVSIEYNGMGALGMGALSITDTETNETYTLKYLDDGGLISDFPPLVEFKLVIED